VRSSPAQVGDFIVALNGQALHDPMKNHIDPTVPTIRLRVERPASQVQDDGLAVKTLTVVVNRGDKRLGLMLDDANVVLEVKPNSPANGLILSGDQVIELDYVVLGDRRLAQVLQPRPTHTFKVCRYVQA